MGKVLPNIIIQGDDSKDKLEHEFDDVLIVHGVVQINKTVLTYINDFHSLESTTNITITSNYRLNAIHGFESLKQIKGFFNFLIQSTFDWFVAS